MKISCLFCALCASISFAQLALYTSRSRSTKSLTRRATIVDCAGRLSRGITEEEGILEAISDLERLANAGAIASALTRDNEYEREKMEFHFRRSNRHLRLILHAVFNDVRHEAYYTLHPQEAEEVGHNQFSIRCSDSERRCRRREQIYRPAAYITSDGQFMVIVCLSLPITYELMTKS